MGDPAKKIGAEDEAVELSEDDVQLLEESSAPLKAVPPSRKTVPAAPETEAEKDAREYTEALQRKYDELGIEKFDPALIVKPEEGTIFEGKKPARPKTQAEIAEEKRYFESDRSFSADLDTEHLIRKTTRAAIEKATQAALEKPLNVTPRDAMLKPGAQILHEKYGAVMTGPKNCVVETHSGPMAVVSGFQDPHALLMPYGSARVFGVSSPGPKQGNEYLKNQAGFVVKPSVARKTIHVFMAKGLGYGPYVADQGAGLANAALTEAGALLHADEYAHFHLTTLLTQMNLSVNELKKKMKIQRHSVPMLGAELDLASKEKAKLKVASAGNIHCLIINPKTGHVSSPPRQVVEDRLKSKGYNTPERREGIYKEIQKKMDISLEDAPHALTSWGGQPMDEFKPDYTEYSVPAGHVVVFVTDELVRSLPPDFKNREFVIGKFIREALEAGLSVEEACATIAQGYISAQKKIGMAESFSLVGLQVPGEVQKPVVEPQEERKTASPSLELDFSELEKPQK